jgi:hypothetical protein
VMQRDNMTQVQPVYVIHAKKGRPYAGRPFLVEIVGQRPLPTVEVAEPTVACGWFPYTQL